MCRYIMFPQEALFLYVLQTLSMSDNVKDPSKPKFALKNYQIVITIGGKIFQTNIQRQPLLKLL